MASLSTRRPLAPPARGPRPVRSTPPLSVRELAGTWRLVHAQQYYSDGELHDESGSELTGNLTYSEDGNARVALDDGRTLLIILTWDRVQRMEQAA